MRIATFNPHCLLSALLVVSWRRFSLYTDLI